MSMSFAHPLTFLRRVTAVSIMLACSAPIAWGASSPAKITVHIPGKSLAVMVFYFGKDKGFFFEEGIDAQLVAMSPPVAIAAHGGRRVGLLHNTGSGNCGDHAGVFA